MKDYGLNLSVCKKGVMGKKGILLVLFGIILLYPIFTLFQLDQAISDATNLDQIEDRLLNYQISIWISWVFLVSMGIYYKWTRKRNLFFTLTYGFLFVAFCIFGTYTQMAVNLFQVPSSFEDNYTLGVFTAVQNILVSAVLTGFLQAGVWWFTRRWHRQM